MSAENTLIGVGGWDYLPMKRNKLEVCAKLYDFVELNSIYYRLPSIETVRRWRTQVPENFEFTIRANRELTHVGHLKPTKENFQLYERMLEISDALKARILHFQFPPSFEVTDDVIADWRDFFKSERSQSGLHKAFEIRNVASMNSNRVKSFLTENDFIPTVDASRLKMESSADSKIAYTRVFGHGEHTQWSFDSSELQQLKENVESTPARRRYVTFHNITMYEDASRMRTLVKGTTGHQIVSRPSGLDSFKDTLSQAQISFPVSKAKLRSTLSWRTFDLTNGKKVHLGEYLEQLPDSKQYESVSEILKDLPSLVVLGRT